ncbi:hypothetical protein TNCT_188381 [Trichonephila clavata]|uniref:Uncharacterized protein n=1 Tax=Trichonephila clavata TaxID=2740835 RepID=A0A8X6KKS6_TRICU|nr:hypothetical protein TNCT_188381 [Trichonephila clavata]
MPPVTSLLSLNVCFPPRVRRISHSSAPEFRSRSTPTHALASSEFRRLSSFCLLRNARQCYCGFFAHLLCLEERRVPQSNRFIQTIKSEVGATLLLQSENAPWGSFLMTTRMAGWDGRIKIAVSEQLGYLFRNSIIGLFHAWM